MSPTAGPTTLTARRSVRLATWVRAWRAGLVPFDDLAGHIGAGEEQLVADVPGTWTDSALAEALPHLSRLHPDEVRLVLPVPGDPRGLPGPGPFTGAALVTGEAVIAGRFGLVPDVRRHVSGSGDAFETVLWRMFTLSPAPPGDPGAPGCAETEAELAAALHEATAALARLDVARWRPELAGALAAIRRPGAGTELPPGYDPRARRLYARAAVLDRVLELAEESAPGGAVTSFEAQRRDEALRPLTAACRRALVAACNAPLHP
jgi:hypothetical protein